MRGQFSIRATDDMPATLTLTGPVGDFRALAKRIREDGANAAHTWPVCDLLRQLDDLVNQAEKTFYSTEGKPGDAV